MGKGHFLLIYLYLYYLYVGLSKEENVRAKSIKFRADVGELSSNPFLESSIEKKKDFIKIPEDSIFPNEHEHNKKNINLEQDKWSLHYSRGLAFPHLGNSDIYIKRLHPILLKKNKLSLFKTPNMEKKNKELIVPENSFIQEMNLGTNNGEISDNYSELIKKIKTNITLMEKIKQNVGDYRQYKMTIVPPTKNLSKHRYIIKKLEELQKYITENIEYYQFAKDEVEKKMDDIKSKNGKEQDRPIIEELMDFRRMINDYNREIDNTVNEYTKKSKSIYSNLDYRINGVMFESFPSDCVNYIEGTVNNVFAYDIKHETYLKNFNDFIIFSNIVIRSKEKQLNQNETLKLLNNIKNGLFINKGFFIRNGEYIKNNRDSLKNGVKINPKVNPKNIDETNSLLNFIATCEIRIAYDKNLHYIEHFDTKKAEFYDILRNSEKDLNDKLIALVYPKDLLSEGSKIKSDSQSLLDRVNGIINESSRTIQYISNNYHGSIFSSIKNEITQKYAKMVSHNDNMKQISANINKIYINIDTRRYLIERAKDKKLFLSKESSDSEILNFFYTRENYESNIKTIYDSFNQINHDYNKLMELKGQVEALKANILEKNIGLQLLKQKEDESKKKVINLIKNQIEQIKSKIDDLNKVKKLKGADNEDLKAIEVLIRGASCDMKEYTKRKDDIEKQINTLTNNLAVAADSDTTNRISQFIVEKNELHYDEYGLNELDAIFDEAKQNFYKMENIIVNTRKAQVDMRFAVNKIKKLRNDVKMKLIEDLHNKMKISFENFKIIKNRVSSKIANYKTKEVTFKNYESNILKIKNEFLNKHIEEDKDNLSRGNIIEEVSNFIKNHSIYKDEITKQINNEKGIIKTIKDQLKLYNEVETFFIEFNNNKTVKDFKTLKNSINEENIDNKLLEHQENFKNATDLIDNSTNMIKLLNEKIEIFKAFNSIINGSNKNNKSIEALKKDINSLKEKINAKNSKINEDALINEEEKNNTLSKLKEKIDKIDNIIKEADDLNKKSSALLESSENLKKTVDNIQKENEINIHSQDELKKKSEMTDITNKINDLKSKSVELEKDIESIIQNHNASVAKSFYDRVLKLEHDINNEVREILNNLEATKQNFENFSSENDMKKIKNDDIKKQQNTIIQDIKNNIKPINSYEEKIRNIKEKLKIQTDKVNGENKNIENLNIPESNMKNINEEMIKILEELNLVKKESEHLIEDLNMKKLKYDKTFINDFAQQINDEKKKAEKDMTLIEELKVKVEKLKEKLQIKESNIESFNCEEHVNNAKKNKDQIIEIEVEANKLKEEAHNNSKKEYEIDSIKKKIEKHIVDSIKHRNLIRDSLNEMKNIEKSLVSKNFKEITDDIKNNFQKAKEENEKEKNELKKSEKTKSVILDSFQKAEKLKDSLKINLEENDIDKNIAEVKKLKDNILNNVKNMDNFLTEVEKCKGKISVHHHNIIREKDKLTYLKSHDQDTKKEITDKALKEIENYIIESTNYTNEAEKHSKEVDKNYKLASEYAAKVSDILAESLILAEKIKSEKKKNDSKKKYNVIKDNYSNIKKSLEKSKNKLIELEKRANLLKKEDEEKNEKSNNAFIEIESIKKDASIATSDIEIIEKSTEEIFNNVENAINLISAEPKNDEGNNSDKLKIEQDYLKSILDALEKEENSKTLLNNEEIKLKQIENKVNDMEKKLGKHMKTYEEGILEEIKKKSDIEMESIEAIENSINSMIDISVEFFSKHSKKKDEITPLLEVARKKMNELYNTSIGSHKQIENLARDVLDPSISYEKAKEKKDEGKIEKEKLKEQKEMMLKLLNYINSIKKEEGLKMISLMKENINNLNKEAKEKNSIVNKYLEEIKKSLENIKNSDNVTVALNELDQIKNTVNKINKIKIKYPYKNEAGLIHDDIIEVGKFIDINEELKNETINDVKKVIHKIGETLNDINSQENEGRNIINEAENIIKQIKLRIELKETIHESKNRINDVLNKMKSVHEKYVKIKELNTYDEEYDQIFRDNAKYKDLKEIISSCHNKSNEIESELKVDIDEVDSDKFKNSLNDLESTVENSKKNASATSILEKSKKDIEQIKKKLNNKYNNALKKNASVDELSEQSKNSKFALLDLIVAHINIEISKDKLSIERKKEYINSYLKYIQNSHELMTNDVNTSNEYSTESPISKYDSVHLKDANKYFEDFKKKEQDTLETIGKINNVFPLISETKSDADVNEAFQTLKELHKKLKKEKRDLNNIYKNINDSKLIEMEENAKKYFDIAKAYESFPDIQEKKLLDNKDELKKIEDYMKEKEQESQSIESSYTEESLKKANEIYEKAKLELVKIKKLEDDNNNENKEMKKYEQHISYLIKRTKTLLDDTEYYQYENNYELSDEENKKINDESNESIKRTHEKTNESKHIFENILRKIEKNKEILSEKNDTILNIYDIIKKLEKTEKYIKKGLDAKEIENNIENRLKKIIRVTNESINNNIYNEKMRTITEKVKVRKEGMEKFKNSNEVNKEINNIQNDNSYLKEQKYKIQNILEIVKNEKEEMDKEFNNMSEGDNFMAYSNSQEHIYKGEGLIKKIVGEIDRIENLIKENENIVKEFEDHNKESDGGNNKSGRRKFDYSKIKLAGGILGGLLVCSGVIFIAFYKNKHMDTAPVNEEFNEFDNDNEIFDLDIKDVAIDVNFVEND
ncbi:reticulocyte binding protein, putative [Plasmodium relictum]|uniref:Reticulocyte binding protein, putative n=1 Tax=Plasmodium relictum TaxID=85471 RepID=A0A1J1H7K7_PLARL|nr:reticulocyte binding protein, putative [Plasmodium relictum]CRG99573.1 reticulocyte binding protein, putative [Plasmodium relictum]